MKNFFIIANWKLNSDLNMISRFFEYLKSHSLMYLEKKTIVIAPPAIYLAEVNKNIRNINIFLGAQNVDINVKGAFTGEISVLMLKDIGVKYVIVGHSERRLIHGETNDTISKKFHLIKKANLIPILCVGETKKDKKYGRTQKVIQEQLDSILQKSKKPVFNRAIIAYEPVWAIGTGLSADPEYVQLIHKFIKSYIEKNDLIHINDILVQYGGSINNSNIKKFFEQPDINGFLIGNASLNAQEFLKIIKTTHDLIKYK